MAAGPNRQPKSKTNLPSLRASVDEQASSFIRRGLNLAQEIEATLCPNASDPTAAHPFNTNHEGQSCLHSTGLSEITTQIQPTLIEQSMLAMEDTNDTSWATVWLRRGIHKYEQADYSGAKSNFKQALQKQPALAAAYNGLGGVLYQDKDFAAAIAVYNQALDLVPQNAQIHCNLGSALYQTQNFDEAALFYQKAMYFNPYLQAAYYGLGLAHAQIGFQEEAVTAFEQSAQLNCRHAESFLGLGAALYELGEYQDANFALRQAMTLDSQYIEVYLRFQNALFA
ncbi:tetratricopeptide repeat protein [Acaryochloris sp. IP29b_bin.148]|uniref:tetratricopeptide repeat protein n=1 Tax=Acaryochloris sp. IP29b_bin.148 TaxID=2969218 RepID=UPI00260C3C6C|nr:tetratricopeptide repeat protein [Acaryochloris sp. IP29b_bin.148]